MRWVLVAVMGASISAVFATVLGKLIFLADRLREAKEPPAGTEGSSRGAAKRFRL